MKQIVFSFVLIALLLCCCHSGPSERAVTADMAFSGVSHYCHQEYGWDASAGDSSAMSLSMGEETDSTYQVVFRSYTGAYVYFYVNKSGGVTRLEEYVPALDLTSPAGTIDLFDHLEQEP